MLKQKYNLEHSDEVQEVLQEVPSWFASWGTTILFFLFACILIWASQVTYPDFVSSDVEIKTGPVMQTIFAKTDGAVKYFVQNGDTVGPGTALGAVFENEPDKKILKFSSGYDLRKQAILDAVKNRVYCANLLEGGSTGAVQADILINNLSQLLINFNNLIKIGSKSKQIQNNPDVTGKISVLTTNINKGLSEIDSYLKVWKSKHLILAVISGKVYFPDSEKLAVRAGEPIFSVLTPHMATIAVAKVAIKKIAKIKRGQLVNINLEKYPVAEYGLLLGVVEGIITKPGTPGFSEVRIKLPQGLLTTYHRKIDYSPNLHGICKIITDNKSIANRIFSNFNAR